MCISASNAVFTPDSGPHAALTLGWKVHFFFEHKRAILICWTCACHRFMETHMHQEEEHVLCFLSQRSSPPLFNLSGNYFLIALRLTGPRRDIARFQAPEPGSPPGRSTIFHGYTPAHLLRNERRPAHWDSAAPEIGACVVRFISSSRG